MIKIKCESSNFLALNEITDFQGDLKERSAGDMEKIKKSIKKHGVAFPIFIWQTEENGETINYCLDGHCRTRALREMAAAGEQIPPLPVDYIHAETEAEAKELLLKLISQYGHMTAESVLEFVGDTDIELEDLQLPDTMLNFSTDTFEGEDTADETNPGDVNFKYQNQYGVIVMCNSEREQESVYNRLSGEGYTCKVVTV